MIDFIFPPDTYKLIGILFALVMVAPFVANIIAEMVRKDKE